MSMWQSVGAVPRWSITVGALLLSTSLLACSAGAPPSQSPTPSNAVPNSASTDPAPQLMASFYPLAFVASRITGETLRVRDLTPSGAEPHDLELSPSDVAAVSDAPLVIYLAGFQPSVDEAVGLSRNGFDVSAAARLIPAASSEHEHEGESESEHSDHAEESVYDPHFWLDPTRLADVAHAISERLAERDPAHANDFRRNAQTLISELNALDAEFATGLSTCTSRDLVTSHEAFGYLTARYGLTQRGLAGLSPDAEPSPRALARLIDDVRANDVRTIYYETLVSPDVAQTVARETGAATAVLDPLEGASPGLDYLEVMRNNLQTLRKGQPCP